MFDKSKSEEIWEAFDKAKAKGDHAYTEALALWAKREEKKEKEQQNKELKEILYDCG